MTTVGVTGADGFLAWHLRCRLHLLGLPAVTATRDTFADPAALDAFVERCDVVVHLAGVNRGSADDVAHGNPAIAEQLVDALDRTGHRIPIAYANSVHAVGDSTYGRSKAAAAAVLAEHCGRSRVPFLDLAIPHVFGEFGRPGYNSVIATFAHALAAGADADVERGGELELVHAQEVAEQLIDFARSPRSARQRLPGRPVTVGDAWDLLTRLHARYVDDVTVPACDSRFELRMFNTLRSHLYCNGHYPIRARAHVDERGRFSELCRADGPGQSSVSTSSPGVTRGDHLHLDKVERFVVLAGEAEIRLRRLLTNDITTFRVSGDELEMIDMPTLVTHNIRNLGQGLLTTLFWAGDHFDADAPDTYPEPVDRAAVVGRPR